MLKFTKLTIYHAAFVSKSTFEVRTLSSACQIVSFVNSNIKVDNLLAHTLICILIKKCRKSVQWEWRSTSKSEAMHTFGRLRTFCTGWRSFPACQIVSFVNSIIQSDKLLAHILFYILNQKCRKTVQ